MSEQQNPNTVDEPRKFGAFTTQKALFELYETAAPHLTKAQLGFLSRSVEKAQERAENLAEIAYALGTFICEGAASTEAEERIDRILWQFSYEFDTIAGLIHIGDSARSRLMYPERYKLDEVLEPGDSHADQ